VIYYLVHDNFKHPLCKPETEGRPRLERHNAKVQS